MKEIFLACLVVCCGCSDDKGSSTNADPDADLLEALRNSDSVLVGTLTEEGIDAGSMGQFHGAILRSELVEASNSAKHEIIELLSARSNYMSSDNACFDYDVALRVSSDSDPVDIIVGLTCNNVTFFRAGVRIEEYMNEDPLIRLAELAHEVVPTINVTIPLD